MKEKTLFVGLSAYLQEGGEGHFEDFHRSFFDEAKKRTDIEVVYWGRESRTVRNYWFSPRVPSTLTSRIPWAGQRFIKELSELCMGRRKVIFHVYEGNFVWVILFAKVLSSNPNAEVIVNFFNGQKYAQLLRSGFVKIVLRNYLRLITRGIEKQIVFSADTNKSAVLLESSLKMAFKKYPIYSGFQIEKASTITRGNRSLVVGRGQSAASLLENALREVAPNPFPKIDYKGEISESTAKILEDEFNVKLVQSHLSRNSYFKSYADYYRVVFLYDPSVVEYNSSGRLCDAIVTAKEIAIPEGSSLLEEVSMNDNVDVFSFGDTKELARILVAPRKSHVQYSNVPTAVKSVKTIFEWCPTESSMYLRTNDFALARGQAIRVSLWCIFVTRLLFALKKRLKERIFLRS